MNGRAPLSRSPRELLAAATQMFGQERVVGKDALDLAVLRDEAEPGVDRGGRRRERDRPAVEPDLAAFARHRAEDRLKGFGPAGADQSGEADDLACTRLERDAQHPGWARQVTDRKPWLAREPRAAARRKYRPGRPAGHELDQLLDRGVCSPTRADIVAVAQHRDAVGQGKRLLQQMRDEDDADALAADQPDPAEQLAALVRRQRRGRLVQQDHPRRMGESAGNLDQLPLGLAEAVDPRRGIDPSTDEREARFGAGQHDAPIDVAEPARDGVREHRRRVDQDVLGNAQRRQQRELLMHHHDAALERGARGEMLERLAVELERALVRLDMAAHDLDERALPRAVLAEQRVDLAVRDREAGALQRLGGAEPLAYAARLEAALQARRHDSWRQIGKGRLTSSRRSRA